MERSNANISRNHGLGSDITGAATPRRGWIWYRGAIRRTGEAMTCGSPSVSRFRPHPGYIHRLPHPCHVLSLDRASPRDHTYVHRYTPYGPLFRGIWIRARKMHPYLTGIRENEQGSRCKFLWKPAPMSSRRMEERHLNSQSRARRIYLPWVIKYRFASSAWTLFEELRFFVTGGWFYLLAMPYVVKTMWFLMWAYVFWCRLYSEKKFFEYLTSCDMRIIRYRK